MRIINTHYYYYYYYYYYLQAWLAENRSALNDGDEDDSMLLDQHAEICCTIDSVKEQQKRVIKVGGNLMTISQINLDFRPILLSNIMI